MKLKEISFYGDGSALVTIEDMAGEEVSFSMNVSEKHAAQLVSALQQNAAVTLVLEENAIGIGA